MLGNRSLTQGVHGLCALLLSAGVFTATVHANPFAKPKRERKVTLCHYAAGNFETGQEIQLEKAAIASHLAHGDIQGPCASDCRSKPSSCNDADACTTDVSCSDGNACTLDVCNAKTGRCDHTAFNCDDGDPCTADSCNADGTCGHTAATCDDGNPCTADSCTANGCTAEPVVCDAGEKCDVATGECVPRHNCGSPPLTWTIIATPSNNISEELPGSFNAEQCCLECWNTPGCTYWYQFSGDDACFVSQQTGATGANECPAGTQTIDYAEGLPAWNIGPCGATEP